MNSRCLLFKGKDYFPVRTMFGEKKRRRLLHERDAEETSEENAGPKD